MMGQPEQEKFQVRIFLRDDFAEAARCNPHASMLVRLNGVLAANRAKLLNQLDLLDSFVGAFAAHAVPEEQKPALLRWTEAVVGDPAKREKYRKAFVVAVNGEEPMEEAVADRLIAGFESLQQSGVVTKIMKISYDPDKNPQAPPRFR